MRAQVIQTVQQGFGEQATGADWPQYDVLVCWDAGNITFALETASATVLSAEGRRHACRKTKYGLVCRNGKVIYGLDEPLDTSFSLVFLRSPVLAQNLWYDEV